MRQKLFARLDPVGYEKEQERFAWEAFERFKEEPDLEGDFLRDQEEALTKWDPRDTIVYCQRCLEKDLDIEETNRKLNQLRQIVFYMGLDPDKILSEVFPQDGTENMYKKNIFRFLQIHLDEPLFEKLRPLKFLSGEDRAKALAWLVGYRWR